MLPVGVRRVVGAALTDETLLRVGVVGVGALGRHHVRILSELPGVELVGVLDADLQAAEAMASAHATRVVRDLDEFTALVDAAVVATPTVSHAEVGCRLLAAGRHVLVEKPIAASLVEADALVAAAEASGCVLAVGHVECANPAVQVLLANAGTPRFVEAERLGVFSPRSLDVDVVLDLMIHDLQILHRLDPSQVREIRATGIDVLSPRVDIANVRLELASGCVANLTASRVSADRVRKLRAFGHQAYFSLDYREQELKGYRLEAGPDGARAIAPIAVEVVKAEPLRCELEGFVAACRGERSPVVDGREGRRALATALEIVAAMGGR